MTHTKFIVPESSWDYHLTSFRITWKCILVYMDVAHKTNKNKRFRVVFLFLSLFTMVSVYTHHYSYPCKASLAVPLWQEAVPPSDGKGRCGRKEETGLHAFPSVPLHPPLPPPPTLSFFFHPSPCQLLANRSRLLGVKAAWLHGRLQCWLWSGIMMPCDSAHSTASPSGRLMLS